MAFWETGAQCVPVFFALSIQYNELAHTEFASSMANKPNLCWRVNLHNPQVPYDHAYLQHEREGNSDWVVVVVSVAKLIEHYLRDDGYVVRPVEQWDEDFRRKVQNRLDPTNGGYFMPRIGSFRFVESKSIWRFWSVRKDGVISFGNGRHRTRFLQFAGATDIPVSVSTNSQANVMAYCGGDATKCPIVPVPN